MSYQIFVGRHQLTQGTADVSRGGFFKLCTQVPTAWKNSAYAILIAMMAYRSIQIIASLVNGLLAFRVYAFFHGNKRGKHTRHFTTSYPRSPPPAYVVKWFIITLFAGTSWVATSSPHISLLTKAATVAETIVRLHRLKPQWPSLTWLTQIEITMTTLAKIQTGEPIPPPNYLRIAGCISDTAETPMSTITSWWVSPSSFVCITKAQLDDMIYRVTNTAYSCT